MKKSKYSFKEESKGEFFIYDDELNEFKGIMFTPQACAAQIILFEDLDKKNKKGNPTPEK